MKTNYYQKYKEKLEAWKEVCKRYQNFLKKNRQKAKKAPRKIQKKC